VHTNLVAVVTVAKYRRASMAWHCADAGPTVVAVAITAAIAVAATLRCRVAGA